MAHAKSGLSGLDPTCGRSGVRYSRCMIFIADNSWLTGVVAFAVLIVVGVVAFLVTRRWGWKGWPLLLCSALFVPILASVAAIAALYYIGVAGGFVVHANWVLLIILTPTIIGASIGSASRRHSVNGS